MTTIKIYKGSFYKGKNLIILYDKQYLKYFKY